MISNSILPRSPSMFGPLHVRQMDLASEVIFTDWAIVDYRQQGCVRFSFTSEGSRMSCRFRCQPELALVDKNDLERQQILARLWPAFTASHYGSPAIAQLSSTCQDEIRTGAEDGSEIGAWCFLKQPQREANLRASLDEYLRFGLEAGLFLVS